VVAILNFPSTPKKTYFVEISVENSNQVCYQKKELHLHIFQNGPILNLSCFVEHLTFLSKIGSELPALENEFILVNKLFTIAKDFNVNILPEEMALY
jgi:hypothetical protein